MLVTLTGFLLLLLLLLLKRCHSGIGATTSKSVVVDVLLFNCLSLFVFYSWRKGLYSHSEAFSHRVRKSVAGSGVQLENTTTLVIFWRGHTFTTTRIELRAKQGQLSTNLCLPSSL